MPSTEHKTIIFAAKGDEFNQQVAQMDLRLTELASEGWLVIPANSFRYREGMDEVMVFHYLLTREEAGNV